MGKGWWGGFVEEVEGRVVGMVCICAWFVGWGRVIV